MKTNIKNRISLILAVVAVPCLLTFSVSASGMTAEETVRLVNEARKSKGLETLSLNESLSLAAQRKMEDMLRNDYFAHTSPEGKSPWNWIESEGYQYEYAGENLAMNYADPESQQQAWMKSESHRKNILNPNYQEIGVAVGRGTVDGKEVSITVHEFGTQRGYVASAEDKKSWITDPAWRMAILSVLMFVVASFLVWLGILKKGSGRDDLLKDDGVGETEVSSGKNDIPIEYMIVAALYLEQAKLLR